MGDPSTEQDTSPPNNTVRRYVWQLVAGVKWARAFWGRRLVGAAIGLIGDALAEGVTQAIYARFPGHPHQAPDSLRQVGADRQLLRFRGETDANWVARVQDAWDDYAQGGTTIQLLHVINQWGQAGWPATWDASLVTCAESGDPDDWWFVLTIGFGCISPPWLVWAIGDGTAIGDLNTYIGVGPSTDIAVLTYLVRKWKRSASRSYIKVYYTATDFVVFGGELPSS